MSYGIVLRSEDGGQTWSMPYDLRSCMKPEDRERGGLVPLSHRAKFDPGNRAQEGYMVHLHSIGTTRNGAVVAINNHGVFAPTMRAERGGISRLPARGHISASADQPRARLVDLPDPAVWPSSGTGSAPTSGN
ncbi:MAG: hypothetical protein R3C53_22480 [Pirellulaceae bacterium]